MGRKLKLSFLVIDDDETFCKSASRRLTSLAKSMELDEHWRHSHENSLELKFIPVYPQAGEPAADFKHRTNSIISDRRTEETGRISSLAGILVDLDFQMSNGSERFQGIEFAKMARQLSPSLIRVLITNHDPDDEVEKDYSLFDWAQHKYGLTEDFSRRTFIEKLVVKLRERFEAPFWDGLRQYAGKDKIVLHAMANTDNRTRRRSVTVDNFVDFFGRAYFKAEASATSNPLDSLLHPVSTIKRAESLAAKAFGARDARFVTNGTTTSNKIVHQALCRAGELVLLDRFCHISHHYAVCMTRSWPVYMDAGVHEETEIPYQVSPEQISSFIDNRLSHAGKNASLPRLIAITNSTFDGMLLQPRCLFEAVASVLKKHDVKDRLREIAFLFDEAWFGFARFHPRFAEFSALTARERLARLDDWWAKNLRVYVTQSMHKTMTSFRQGSMILISDPVLDESSEKAAAHYLGQRLDNAFSAHTTTSPHAGMIASLDVGRRQIAFEGRDLLNQTVDLAEEFRAFLDRMGELFRTADGLPAIKALRLERDLAEHSGDQLYTDPTKITVKVEGWISGKDLRTEFWDEHGIQVNKYGPDTILCLFTIGIDDQDVTELKQKIQSFLSDNKSRIESHSKSDVARPSFPVSGIQYIADNGAVDDAYKAAIENRSESRFDPGSTLIGSADESIEVLPLTTLVSLVGEVVSTGFVVPYPPGYPILIPGQILTNEILIWLIAQFGREIHGLLTIDGEASLAVRRV